MATADELLAESGEAIEEVLVIDLNTRIISIPASIKVLGVEADDDVKRLQFSVPRYYGELDLSEFVICVNFTNARNNEDLYPVDDLTISDTGDTMTFSWLVDRSAFTYDGKVSFSVCMKLFDETGIVVKELNTTIAQLPVLPGLETSKAVVENNPSAFDAVLYRLYAIEAAMGLGIDDYYTIKTVDESEEGIVFTLVNASGTIEKVVKHGIDGFTPVKGVDYWTDEEQEEILTTTYTRAKAYIDTWAPYTTTVSLLAAAWSDNEQTVNVAGMTEDSIVFVAPGASSDNYISYTENQVRCMDQAAGKLTFQCTTVPTIDLEANIAVYYGVDDDATGSITVIDDGEGNVTIL